MSLARCTGLCLLVLLSFFSERTSAKRRLLGEAHKYAVKTIQSHDGDVVDCVDFYKQPAFDHPLLRNLDIKKRPSFAALRRDGSGVSSPAGSNSTAVKQSWNRHGSCPTGTVPIVRMPKFNNISDHAATLLQEIRPTGGDYSGRIEFAGAELLGAIQYNGIKARINVWTLVVDSDEWSTSSMVLGDGHNYVESGYGVMPVLYHDLLPRFHTNWIVKPANGPTRGCFNVLCSGFVQTSKKVAVGAAMDSSSVLDGPQYDLKPEIQRDPASGWWLVVDTEVMGFWPNEIFDNFTTGTEARWLGAVANRGLCTRHTTTEMGSGRHASEGIRKAAFFSAAKVAGEGSNNAFVFPTGAVGVSPWSGCYSFAASSSDITWEGGLSFFFGGAGGLDCCTD